MKKFVLGLVLFLGGCVDFGLFFVVSAADDGLGNSPILLIFSLLLMVCGIVIIYREASKEQDKSSPEQ